MSQQETARPQLKATSTVPRYAWVILVVVFLASVAAPLNQAKVPPVLPVLIETFSLDLAAAGMLMSVFAISGFILALPAGFILHRFGSKTSGLVAMGFIVAGAVMGALSNTASLLLSSRFVEGVGMGLIAVVGPAAIALWFPAKKRGTPMGLWATWVPLGSLIMYSVAPALAASFGWHAVWWAGAAFALVAFVLYLVLFRVPTAAEMAAGGERPAEQGAPPAPVNLRKAMANRYIWLLGLEFMCFNVAGIAVNSFYPTFLNIVRNYSLAGAAFTASLGMISTIISSPIGGWLSDRIGSRKRIIVIPFIIVTFLYLLPFRVTGWQIPALMLLIGFVTGPVPTASFAAVPEVMVLPQLAGIGMAVLALGQNLGMFIGPWGFGKLLDTMTWTAAGLLIIPVCLVGIVAGWLVKVR